jgi:Uri superfamily endonuclease
MIVMNAAVLRSLPVERGAYALVIDLARPLALEIPRFIGSVLPAGRYVYCGSAYGAGGIAARVARHRRVDKKLRWHMDHLTWPGTVVDVLQAAGGRECALLAAVLATPGAHVPLWRFGSTDCATCPAHLVAVGSAFAAAELIVDHSTSPGKSG